MMIKSLESSRTPITLTPSDLVALKEAKVPDEVIRAAGGAQKPLTPPVQAPTDPAVPNADAQPRVVTSIPSGPIPERNLASGPGAPPQAQAPRIGLPRVYVQPQEGFESYLSAAIVKKKVPVVVTQNKDDAWFILTSVVAAKEESTGSKIARCLFAYCIGMEGNQTVTVQLVNIETQEVAWAYNVKKGSAKAYQSTAEAVAKHLNEFIKKSPK
jgi:hypothetical protein